MASITKILSEATEVRARVVAGTTGKIGVNDIVILDGGNAGYVTIAPTGSTNAQSYVGVARSESTETATDDGFVVVAVPVHGGTDMILKVLADDAADLVRAAVGTQVVLAVGTKGAQTMDFDNTTNGIFRVLDPHDNVFDTTNGLHNVAMPTIPWGTFASVRQ